MMEVVNQLKAIETQICDEKNYEAKIKDVKLKIIQINSDSGVSSNEKIYQLKQLMVKCNDEADKLTLSIKTYQKLEKIIFKAISGLKQEFYEGKRTAEVILSRVKQRCTWNFLIQ